MGEIDPVLQQKSAMNNSLVQMKREQLASLENPNAASEIANDASNFINTVGSASITLAFLSLFAPEFRTIKNVIPTSEAKKIVSDFISKGVAADNKEQLTSIAKQASEKYGNDFASNFIDAVKAQTKVNDFSIPLFVEKEGDFYFNKDNITASKVADTGKQLEWEVKDTTDKMVKSVEGSLKGEKLDVRGSSFLTAIQDKFPGGIKGAVIAGVALLGVASVIAARSQRQNMRNIAAAQTKSEINAMEFSFAEELAAQDRHEELLDAVAGNANTAPVHANATEFLAKDEAPAPNAERVSAKLDAILSAPETTIPSAEKGEERSAARVEEKLNKILS